MCGIAGFFLSGPERANRETFEHTLKKMGNAIRRRGPDDSGLWVDERGAIGLVHQRLSILDLSPAGHQPMISPSGRYVIAFNGEIYNHREIRREIVSQGPGFDWRGHSDTETILAGFDCWGIVPTIKRCSGMFAMAIWDRESQILTLIRDRLGEKPLYYGWQRGVFLFGSELKSLKEHPSFENVIDRDAALLMMRHNNVPAPYSIYKGIHKLMPGAVLEMSMTKPSPKVFQYWDPYEMFARSTGLARSMYGEEEVLNRLETLLTESVAQQMMADVPLGAFLSGGVDSSTVVALMQSLSARPIKTFSIGFNEGAYNEAQYAKAVAEHLGTDHTELYVTSADALAVIPELPNIYCEPFADPSQIPTYLVSALARKTVTVALSGDGGDELFGGYSRYKFAHRVWGGLQKIPANFRKNIGRAILAMSPSSIDRCLNALQTMLPPKVRRLNLGDKAHKGAKCLSADSPMGLYALLMNYWPDTEGLVAGAGDPDSVFSYNGDQFKTDNFYHQMMATDLVSYLPDDILVKVDRAAMFNSLETRVPLLDYRLVEFAWSLPIEMKVNAGVGKSILKDVLYKYVPRSLIDRPKMGFGVPIDQWLRGPLRSWSDELLSKSCLEKHGVLNPNLIRKRWQEHLDGKRNWQYSLWNALMFQAWCESNQ